MAAPKIMPQELVSEYTLHGRIAVAEWYLDDTIAPAGELVFSQAQVAELTAKAERRETNYYKETDNYLYAALEEFPIRGLDCVVMGTQVPWYEAIALVFGASSVTTIEYCRARSEDARLRFLTPDDYDRAPRRFDCAFAISSFEHDGLGRYGDPLNPAGDFAAMQKMKQIVTPGGLLYLAVPVAMDKLVWNAHRIYGRIRLPMLLQGWTVLAAIGYAEALYDIDTGWDAFHQPVFVLKNS